MSTRWCPHGQHELPRSAFRTTPTGGLARDCMRCEAAARARDKHLHWIATARKDGVDIDRIHAIMKANPRAARRRA